MNKCIFCEIIKNRSNIYVLYETKKTICFLDVKPISKGHCLIVPKKHFDDIYEIDDVYLKDVIHVAKKVSDILRTKLNATGVNILHASGKDAQQSVFHFHIHLVPRYHNDGLNTWPKSEYTEKSLKNICRKITS